MEKGLGFLYHHSVSSPEESAMVRPIDLQDNLSKAPLAGREQQIQQSSADLAQRQLSQALNQEHILDQSRTRPSAATDATENRVDDREARRGQGDSGQRRRQDDGDDGQESLEHPSDADSGDHLIDVLA